MTLLGVPALACSAPELIAVIGPRVLPADPGHLASLDVSPWEYITRNEWSSNNSRNHGFGAGIFKQACNRVSVVGSQVNDAPRAT